jgi:hypothetical protein
MKQCAGLLRLPDTGREIAIERSASAFVAAEPSLGLFLIVACMQAPRRNSRETAAFSGE